MFTEVTVAAEIHKVAVSVERADGLVMRTCRLTLAREFDDLLASQLGPDARKALSGVKSHGMEKVVLPIGRVRVSAALRAVDDYCEIGAMRGIKATAAASTKADVPPTIKLEFEFTFQEAAWAFLGRNIAALAQVSLKATQEDFGFPEPPLDDEDNEAGAH